MDGYSKQSCNTLTHITHVDSFRFSLLVLLCDFPILFVFYGAERSPTYYAMCVLNTFVRRLDSCYVQDVGASRFLSSETFTLYIHLLEIYYMYLYLIAAYNNKVY